MSNEHPVTNEVVQLAQASLQKENQYMAYNNSLYMLDKTEVAFFASRDEAEQFCADNISDHDHYSVLHFTSMQDLIRQMRCAETISSKSNHDPDVNGLYNPDGNAFTDALIDHIESQQSVSKTQLNTNIMNQENLKYLSDNLKYMGFGEGLKADLEKQMSAGKPEFQLKFDTKFGNKGFEATLNFRKSDSTDIYFFNNYNATLEKNNGEKVAQTFYLNKGKGVTAKEAFNLLDGRAVHKDLVTKEGQEYRAWVQLDLTKKTDRGFAVKQFHENFGYDLKAAVEKLAVVELKDPEKEKALLASLQKGNIQAVTIEKDGESHKMFIEANPQFKNVTLYDSAMKMVAKESMGQYQSGVEKGTKAVKEDLADDKKKELKQQQKPDETKAAKKNSKSLLPKKRERKGKGLGVS